MAEISLRRKKKPTVPDNSSNLEVVFEDTANPLLDENGNPKLTSILGEDGNPAPEYPEFVVNVSIPEGSIIDATLVESLMSEALAKGTLQAQERANKHELQAVLKPFLEAYDIEIPVEMFTGKVAEAVEYAKVVEPEVIEPVIIEKSL